MTPNHMQNPKTFKRNLSEKNMKSLKVIQNKKLIKYLSQNYDTEKSSVYGKNLPVAEITVYEKTQQQNKNWLKLWTLKFFSFASLTLWLSVLFNPVKSIQIRNFFWSVFSCFQTRNNSIFRHFSRSDFSPIYCIMDLTVKKFFQLSNP